MAPPLRAQSSTINFTRTRDAWLTNVLGIESWNVSTTNLIEGSNALDISASFRGAAFLTARVPTNNIQVVKRLIELGFYVVDTALTLEFDSRLISETEHRSPIFRSSWAVDDAASEDADSVGLIASRALTTSRFHLDPAIPSEVASAIKSEWARNLVMGRRGIRCRIFRDSGGVKGFLGVVEGTGNQGILVIDLIAVSPESQGTGVGAALVRDFLELAQAHGVPAQVGTQAANTSAVRFYQRLGFTLTSATYVMHAHASTEGLS